MNYVGNQNLQGDLIRCQALNPALTVALAPSILRISLPLNLVLENQNLQ